MQTRYYNSGYGQVTVVQDTSLYQWAQNLDPSDFLLVDGVLTQTGEDFVEQIKPYSVKTYCVTNKGIEDAIVNNMKQVITANITTAEMTQEQKRTDVNLGGEMQITTIISATAAGDAQVRSYFHPQNDPSVTSPDNLAGIVYRTEYDPTPDQKYGGFGVEFIIMTGPQGPTLNYLACQVYVKSEYYDQGGQTHMRVAAQVMSADIPTMDDLWKKQTEYEIPPADPYNPDTPGSGGNGGEGDDPNDGQGGNGTHDDTDDILEEPGPPSIRVSSLGFVNVYVMTEQQLQSLSAYMWSNNFDVSKQKLFANPMDIIMGLTQLPFNVSTSGSTTIKLCGIDTQVSQQRAQSDYVTINSGYYDLKEFDGSYVDYYPFTQVQLFLPYIGMKTLDADVLTAHRVTVKYRVDVMTGQCTAFVFIDKDESGVTKNTIRYAFNGMCGYSIPVSGSQMPNVINSITGVITGAAQAVGGGVQFAASVGSGNPVGMVVGLSQAVSGIANAASNLASRDMHAVQHSGLSTGIPGWFDEQEPYFLITRPQLALAHDYSGFYGLPGYVTRQLTRDNIKGFTSVRYIHLDGIPALESELREIEELLHNGVRF